MTSFSIRNFGCRVNQAEAFSWAEEFQRRGLVLEKAWERSDFVLINSCTLTSRADRDVRRFVQKVTHGNPKACLIVTGCYAERAFEEFQSTPGVWMVVRNSEKTGLAGRVFASEEKSQEASLLPYRSRGLVKIQDGCDFHCAYCVIPSVRGRSASADVNDVLSRIRSLEGMGFRELVLAGIHLCSFGLDLKPKSSLLDLLRRIERIKGPARIRLSSLDPRFLDGPLADHISTSLRICPHFHLSLQSGSERVLNRMGRAEDIESSMNLLERLRQRSPQAALGADIIVGFPGETHEDFEMTRDVLNRSPLTYFHVFPYSPRQGTKAAEMEEQVESGIKRKRASELRALSRRKNLSFRESFLGRELEAVVISRKGRAADVLTGNFIKVVVPQCPADARALVKIRITGVSSQETYGETLKPSDLNENQGGVAGSCARCDEEL